MASPAARRLPQSVRPHTSASVSSLWSRCPNASPRLRPLCRGPSSTLSGRPCRTRLSRFLEHRFDRLRRAHRIAFLSAVRVEPRTSTLRVADVRCAYRRCRIGHAAAGWLEASSPARPAPPLSVDGPCRIVLACAYVWGLTTRSTRTCRLRSSFLSTSPAARRLPQSVRPHVPHDVT